ncbi:hypothetical protein L873DRAFT_1811505, partial [Choiromyces venosus 120613-1]
MSQVPICVTSSHTPFSSPPYPVVKIQANLYAAITFPQTHSRLLKAWAGGESEELVRHHRLGVLKKKWWVREVLQAI